MSEDGWFESSIKVNELRSSECERERGEYKINMQFRNQLYKALVPFFPCVCKQSVVF